MMMTKRIGSDAMLHRLCKDSQADLALLQDEDMKQVLVANLDLMVGKSTNAGRAFAMEYIAFHEDWSDLMTAMQHVPVQIFIAEEDPTFDLAAVAELQRAYPWMCFEVLPDAGLALMFQQGNKLIPILAGAAKHGAQ